MRVCLPAACMCVGCVSVSVSVSVSVFDAACMYVRCVRVYVCVCACGLSVCLSFCVWLFGVCVVGGCACFSVRGCFDASSLHAGCSCHNAVKTGMFVSVSVCVSVCLCAWYT